MKYVNAVCWNGQMSFDTKEGNHVEGTNLYLLAQNPNVEGLEAIKLFVPR